MNAPLQAKPIPATGFPLLGRLSASGGGFAYKGEGSLLTVARAGSGKDRCIITPNLLRYQGSAFITDPKGQSLNETSAWRRTHMEQTVHVFDAFGVGNPAMIPPGCLASFNPIDVIRTSRTPVEDAKVIAASLILAETKQPHFSNGARQLLSGILVYAALDPNVTERTMGQVWRWLRLGASLEMIQGPEGPQPKEDYFKRFLMNVSCSKVAYGYAAGEANAFLRMNPKEAASFLSTLYTNCGSIFDSRAVIESMNSSSVDFGTLQSKPQTVYLVLPGALAETHSRYFRLLLACAFMQIERAGLAPVQGQATQAATLFILNEFFTLGRFDQIVEAMGRMRGYGVKFWSFVQNLSQLKSAYGDAWTNIAGNAGVIQYFGGTGDVFTMDYISKLSGLMEVDNVTFTDPDRGAGSATYSKMSRPVRYPDEIGRLPEGTQFVFEAGKDVSFEIMVYTDRDFPDYQAEVFKLGDLKFICPKCGTKAGKLHKPNDKAQEVRITFPCCGPAVFPHAGPGWRSMRPGEERVTGRLYRTSGIVPDLWDVFEPDPEVGEVEAAPEAEQAPLNPVDAVRASTKPFHDAALEATLCIPPGLADPKLTALARWLLGGVIAFVALEPRYSDERTMAAVQERVEWPYDIFRGFMEGVALSDEADGQVAAVAKAYLAEDDEEAAAIHHLVQKALGGPAV